MSYYNEQLILDKTYREPYYNLANIYNALGFSSFAEIIMLEGLKNSF